MKADVLFVCMTMLDAVNKTLESENWNPIVFDTIIVKKENVVKNIVVENIVV